MLFRSKNVGPRLHYLHNSVGGIGWICKMRYEVVDEGQMKQVKGWALTFEDERYASWFKIMFPE